MFSLRGRKAFVTGASGLLGAHFARLLHSAGAHVVLAARRIESCEKLARELGREAEAIRTCGSPAGSASSRRGGS